MTSPSRKGTAAGRNARPRGRRWSESSTPGTAANSLAAEARRRLGPPPELESWPLVSIVVVNRDGAGHLRRLLEGLRERTDYPRFELIVVDNDSGDDSLELLRTVEASFPIAIVANHRNESFADANNQGAELAQGELLLLLNNDAEPFEAGWLRELVACLRRSGAGAVGATLIEHPDGEGVESPRPVVQQRGLATREWDATLVPAFREQGTDPLGDRLGDDVECLATSAACSLLELRRFSGVGGFTHGYMYGVEDIDLALKLRERGLKALSCGRSLVLHAPGSTLRAVPTEQQRRWQRGNRRLFWERWGPRVRREYELDRLHDGGIWSEPATTADAEAGHRRHGRAVLDSLAYCIKTGATGDGGTGGRERGEALCSALSRRGHRCLLLEGERAEDLVALNYDVAVHLRGPARYLLKASQLNVLWCVSHPETLTAIECSRYDLIVTDSEELARRLGQIGASPPPVAILPASDAGQLAEALAAAVDERARQLHFPTTVDPSWPARHGAGGER